MQSLRLIFKFIFTFFFIYKLKIETKKRTDAQILWRRAKRTHTENSLHIGGRKNDSRKTSIERFRIATEYEAKCIKNEFRKFRQKFQR